MALVIIHYQNEAGQPISGAAVAAVSANGDWASVTDSAGNVIDPGDQLSGVNLTPGDYVLTATKPGYLSEPWPITIKLDGKIRHALKAGGGVLPPPPTRDVICGIKTSLAGLTYQTTQYGPIPAWFYAGLNDTDRAIARQAHLDAGDTHIPVGISEAYRESGTLWPAELREGYDYSYDLPAFREVLLTVIKAGLLVDLPLAGDGLSVNAQPYQGEYNDPVGKTYGYQWLMNELPRIIKGLQGDGTAANPDLTPYIIFRPGWDGVFYGWGDDTVPDPQPGRVKAFGELFRSLLPNGYLAIEHTPGTIPCGEGGADYAAGGLMQNYDTILSEFNTVHEDSCWQVVGRMVQPYQRPPDQPAGDDPHPPFYLAPGNPRGPYFYVAFEPTQGGVYQWCRGQCTLADVNNVRAYLRGLGAALTG